jgi:hypothetical protein
VVTVEVPAFLLRFHPVPLAFHSLATSKRFRFNRAGAYGRETAKKWLPQSMLVRFDMLLTYFPLPWEGGLRIVACPCSARS